MTIAVCIKCGKMKRGALTRCSDCKFDPKTDEDKAKAMILTDHFMPKDQLESYAIDLRKGIPLEFPKDVLEEFTKLNKGFRDDSKFLFRKVKLGCLLLIIIIAVIWLMRGT